MDYIVEFYKGLDSINLLLFWGVIIVITLLLIFSIIMINKNRELKRLVAEKQRRNETKTTNDIPIKVAEEVTKKEPEIVKEEVPPIPMPVEKPFIAEEHVIEYHNEEALPIKEESIPVIKEEHHEEIKEVIMPEIKEEKITPPKEVVIPTGPYQRNVLREMSSNQTSPIGIITRSDAREVERERANDLHTSLSTDNNYVSSPKPQVKAVNNNSFNELAKSANSNQSYLNEVSNKLNEAINGVERTAYEIQQEADAIISYEELMHKKDTIRTVDEEEAVISIGELYQKEKRKLYGITEEEENKEFIDELKNFRDDL